MTQMLEINIFQTRIILEYDIRNVIGFIILLVGLFIILSSTWNYLAHYQAPVTTQPGQPTLDPLFQWITPTPTPTHQTVTPQPELILEGTPQREPAIEMQAPGVRIDNKGEAWIDVNKYLAAGGTTIHVTAQYIDNSHTCYPVTCQYTYNGQVHEWQENQGCYDTSKKSLVSSIVNDVLNDVQYIQAGRLI